jgi:hypothetical protein
MQNQIETLANSSAAAGSIDGMSSQLAAHGSAGEIRLSFKFFYVVLRWGKERRTPDRLSQERENHPVLTATHAPVLAAIWAALFVLLYFALIISVEGLVFLVS